MKVYGWYELSSVCYGIEAREICKEGVLLEDDGRVFKPGNSEDFYGDWFVSFSQAKRFAIKTCVERLAAAKTMRTFFRQLKKKDCE